MNKKAEMGIATLVLFIAVILVVAVVFQVILKTTSSVAGTTKATGKAVMYNVGTAVNIEQAYAEDGSGGNLDYFYLVAKSPAASEAISFSDSVIKMSLDDAGQEYIYKSTIDCNLKDASGASIYNASNKGYFGATFKLNTEPGVTSKTYMVAGDVVELCFKSPATVNSNTTRMMISFTPTKGNGWQIKNPELGTINQKTWYIFP